MSLFLCLSSIYWGDIVEKICQSKSGDFEDGHIGGRFIERGFKPSAHYGSSNIFFQFLVQMKNQRIAN